ncbi:protein arginine methyltransferase 10, partial [Perkinsus olseni]
CWYRTHGRKRSIGIVFDSRNGLADNSTYQLVFNAVVHEAALQANTAHLWIFSMDYIATSPYTVLELGKAGISPDRPPLPPARSTDPNWPAQEAFDALVPALLQNPGDLGVAREITLSIAGERSGLGKIVGDSNLRVYLWPLTAWKASSRIESGRRCEGWCYPAEGMRCGSLNGRCHLEGIGNNDAVVRVIFPDDMTPLEGDVRYTLAIKALPLPVDEVGWFPM